MSKLSPNDSSTRAVEAVPCRRSATAHVARGVQIFAWPSAPAATPVADMVEATLSGEISVRVIVLAKREGELARNGADLVAECRRAFDRELANNVAHYPTPPIPSDIDPRDYRQALSSSRADGQARCSIACGGTAL
jgi:hypothetical protein